ERMQCPPDYVGIAALIALGSVLGRKAAIRPQRKGSWHEHANLWGVVVGEPGSKKSPAMAEAMAPLKEIEDEAWAAGSVEREQYEHRLKEYEAREKVAKKLFEKALQTDPNATMREVTAPPAPKKRRYKVDDATYEALGEILIDNPNGVLSYRDELVT